MPVVGKKTTSSNNILASEEASLIVDARRALSTPAVNINKQTCRAGERDSFALAGRLSEIKHVGPGFSGLCRTPSPLGTIAARFFSEQLERDLFAPARRAHARRPENPEEVHADVAAAYFSR